MVDDRIVAQLPHLSLSVENGDDQLYKRRQAGFDFHQQNITFGID